MFIDTPLVRMGVLLLVALAVMAMWLVLRAWQARRVKQLGSQTLPLPAGVAAQLDGTPAVLAFSTKTCVECRTRQAPALRRLADALGSRVRVVALDPLEHPDLVAHLGILTVPATVVLDGGRHVRHLNLGYASEGVLREQIVGAAS